ncbi:MAG: acylneuraminate cytidylyltransferase family protein [Gammaproteobacteria bacterium]|nr:acylneuraminate cytidylyltransferase family protein [Gammaproteobacteria bacterium]
MCSKIENVAVIPARGGSKAIPNKNLAILGDKPLVVWSIEAAVNAACFDRIIVSTDDDAIAEVARRHGAEISVRPPELATDRALVIDALRDLISRFADGGSRPRILVLLEPTCPFRSADDINRCIDQLRDGRMDSVATFKAAELNPMRAWTIIDDEPRPFIADAVPWLPRQELPTAFQLNGAVYAFRADRLNSDHGSILFGRKSAVMMPPERSLDIDDEFDLKVANAILDISARESNRFTMRTGE